MNITPLKAIAIVSTLCASLSSHAASPVGLWQSHQSEFATGAFINDVDYCILNNGTFYAVGGSPTETGSWASNGQIVLLRFADSSNGFTGSYTLKKTAAATMQGFGQSWFFPDPIGGFNISAVWTKTGSCS